MAFRTANAQGTITNTGTLPTSYHVTLVVHAVDSNGLLVEQELASVDVDTVAPGADSPVIFLSRGVTTPAGGETRAFIVLDAVQPNKPGLATTSTINLREPFDVIAGRFNGLVPTVSKYDMSSDALGGGIQHFGFGQPYNPKIPLSYPYRNAWR